MDDKVPAHLRQRPCYSTACHSDGVSYLSSGRELCAYFLAIGSVKDYNSSKNGVTDRDSFCCMKVVSFSPKQLIRCDLDGDEKISGWMARRALASKPKLLTSGNAGGYLHDDVLHIQDFAVTTAVQASFQRDVTCASASAAIVNSFAVEIYVLPMSGTVSTCDSTAAGFRPNTIAC